MSSAPLWLSVTLMTPVVEKEPSNQICISGPILSWRCDNSCRERKNGLPKVRSSLLRQLLLAKISWNVDSVPLLGRKAHLTSQITAQTESILHTLYIYCQSCMLCTLILCFTVPNYVNLEVGEQNCSQSFFSASNEFFHLHYYSKLFQKKANFV